MLTCSIIGISDSATPWFPPEVEAVIARGHTFSGGRRHHEIMASQLPAGYKWIDITVPLSDVFRQYDEVSGEFIIFASGDPLFYGFAATVQRERPHWQLTIYPSFHSLQLLAHRLCLPYQDMRAVSLTGRPWDALDEALICGERLIGCLTDHHHSPQAIAKRMIDYGFDRYYRMAVGERLGNAESERARWVDMKSSSLDAISFPNCVILERTAVRPRPFGIPEKEFHLLDGRERMITKMPARLLALSLLDLRHRRTLWDVGFCTGSVSIEAKLQFPHLSVVAFEVRPECERLMTLNARRHGTPGILAVMGDVLTADLESLPRPDAVFIGGHGGKLHDIILRLAPLMQPGATLVFNAVSDDSRRLFAEAVREAGMTLVSDTRLAIDNHNPLVIMKAVNTPES
ncbi:MAG: precorrin-6y C5,15-methyltransferase (decarboxylating) subunit CbiE [Bacteroidaceae bacterium]|nr:precorrin-6y C5,15-methyltransferase (decarboxylating) subunit CbiE [Bacteroidaceae bacterium]